jgi:glycosyltransferase involved in cell wall biosynthesis
VVEVIHLTPMMFGAGGMFGGGERYPLELASAMAECVPTRLVGFGSVAATVKRGPLEIRVLRARRRWKGDEVNPVAPGLARELISGSTIHAHQWESVVTNLALLRGLAPGSRVFATDHGGSGRNYWRKYRLSRGLDGFLAVSRFSASFYPELADRTSVIHGGVDISRYRPGAGDRRRRALFVGRLLPHKGVDNLIKALSSRARLHIIGRPYDLAYRRKLSKLAIDKQVTFDEHAGDTAVLTAYQTSRVLVLPSMHDPLDGPTAPKAELLGLTLLEAMACGTPVICTDVGGMPEIVRDGVTGFVVPSGDQIALAQKLEVLLNDDRVWQQMSSAAVEDVARRFRWSDVARRCLDLYGVADSSDTRTVASDPLGTPSVMIARPTVGGVADVATSCAQELRRRRIVVDEVKLAEERAPAIAATRAAWRHRRTLRSSDIVHVELGVTHLTGFWFAILAATFRPGRTVLMLHDAPSVVAHPGAGLIRTAPGMRDILAHRLLARIADRPLVAYLTRRTALSVVLTDAAAAGAKMAGFDRVEVLSLGADAPTQNRPRPSESTYVLFAGFIGPGKGLDLLYDVWRSVGEHSSLGLKIVGIPSTTHTAWAAELRAKFDTLPRAAEWLGWLDDEQFSHAIARSAVVVLPYDRSNPASGILVRALVEGRAIVATRVPATAGLVDGDTALLAHPGDRDGFASALLKVMNDPDFRDVLGERAASVGASRHTWARHVDELLLAYAHVRRVARCE